MLPALFLGLVLLGVIRLVIWQKELARRGSDAFEMAVFSKTPTEESRLLPDNDPMYWIKYAAEVRQGREWRIRWTYLDNPPGGRPVHWANATIWLIASLGTVCSWVTGIPNLNTSTAMGAFWENPFLMILLVIGAASLLAPRIGVVPAGLLAVLLPLLPPLQWDFFSLRPGHHSLHALCPFLGILALLAGGLGWTSTQRSAAKHIGWFMPLELPPRRQATWLFVLGGVCGGLGLWVGATIQYLVCGFVLFSINLVYLLAGRRVADEGIVHPWLWRWFAISAASSSLLFYFIEYAGTPFRMRLEVNHPIYSLAVLGMGEFTFRMLRSQAQGRWKRSDMVLMFFAAAIGALPLAIMTLGPAAWHALRDPEMARVHHFILEFMAYTNGTFKDSLGRFVGSFGTLIIFLLLPLILSTERLSGRFEWATLCFSFFLSYLLLVAMWFQIRWSGLYSIGLAVLVVVTLNAGWRAARDRKVGVWFPATALVLVLIQIAFYGWQMNRDRVPVGQGFFLVSNLSNPAQMRVLAAAIKSREPGRPVNVMASPDYSPSLAYFDAAHGVSSFYWENVAGLHSTTRFFTSTDDREAQQILSDGAIKYVIVPHDPGFEKGCLYIRYGLSSAAPTPERTILGRLYAKDSKVLSWLRPDSELTTIASKPLSVRGRPLVHPIDVYTVRLPELSRPDFKADTTGM